jgi:hypothetical protein
MFRVLTVAIVRIITEIQKGNVTAPLVVRRLEPYKCSVVQHCICTVPELLTTNEL